MVNVLNAGTGHTLRYVVFVVCCLLSELSSAAGWTAATGTNWGAKVLSITTIEGTSTGVAGATWVWLEFANVSNVNTCPNYSDTTTFGPGVNSAVFVLVHPGQFTVSDVQKTYLAELQAAAHSGKQVRVFSAGCTGGPSVGNNLINGVWVQY